MQELSQEYYTQERAIFAAKAHRVSDTIFAQGESPLKHAEDLQLQGCMFQWKYPLWYGRNIQAQQCTWADTARAGMWYTEQIALQDCAVQAPKSFRRCCGVALQRVTFADAAETLWNCEKIDMTDVCAKGDYFAMNSRDITAQRLCLYGNYPFDGAKNVQLRNCTLLSKDAFWNSENVTVYHSRISGEYIGWNAKNLRLVDCTVESLQGFCYVENLVLENCRLLHTSRAFEYSTVQATLQGDIDGIWNPAAGRIEVDAIGSLMMDPARIDPAKTQIVCRKGTEEQNHGI